MSKKDLISAIEIKQPCAESWAEMRGNDKVRFCEHCAFEVYNLSAATRAEARRLVRRSSGRICLRYEKTSPAGEPIFAGRLYRLTRDAGLAAGLIGAALALPSAVRAQDVNGEPPAIARAASETKADGGAKIAGQITDPNGAAVAFALVTLFNEETNFYQTTNTSAEGFYEFDNLAAGAYKLKIEGGGFNALEPATIELGDGASRRYDARLALPSVAAVVEVGPEENTKTENYVLMGVIAFDPAPRNQLVQAVFNEDLGEVKVRVAMRARVNARDKNYDGITALHAAVELGNLEIAEFLLAHGAKPNSRDHRKRTPLMMLDEDASPQMVELLIRYGAKINLLDKEGGTALHHLAENDAPEMLQLLIKYGASVDAVDKRGRTPLMIAAENDNLESVRTLLAAGADPNRRDKNGETAWSAGDSGEIKTLLESYGAVAAINEPR